MRFQDILGHEREIGLLKRAIEGRRIAHAYLFAGPDGVGKMRLALVFAQALNCEDYRGDCCGACGSCLCAANNSNTNILRVLPEKKVAGKRGEIREEGEIKGPGKDVRGVLKIDQIRDLQRVLRYRAERGWRVAIVDGADLMLRDASSVFLKTLEEPPSGSVIILLTSRPESLLPTILSRCQRINFTSLKEDVISDALGKRCQIKGCEADAIARLSCGSFSKAIKLLEGGLIEKRRRFFERFKKLKKDDPLGILDFALELSKDDGLEDVLEFLKSWYRDAAVAMAGCSGLVVNRDMAEDGPQGVDFEGCLRSFDLTEKTRQNILPPRNANKQLAMEALLIRLVA